jgi:hypothetical protein
VFLDPNFRLTVKNVPNIGAEDYAKLEKMSMDFAYPLHCDRYVP